MVVTSGRIANGGDIALTICNVGGRAASDIELSLSSLQPDGLLEGLKAGDERELVLSGQRLPGVLHIAFSDDRSGRTAHDRALADVNGRLSIGLRKKVKVLDTAGTHLLLPEKDIGTTDRDH